MGEIVPAQARPTLGSRPHIDSRAPILSHDRDPREGKLDGIANWNVTYIGMAWVFDFQASGLHTVRFRRHAAHSRPEPESRYDG